MDANSFIFWIHGFFEISESNSLSEKQVQVIKDHLDLCFNKVTPDRSKEEWTNKAENGLTGVYKKAKPQKIEKDWVQSYFDGELTSSVVSPPKVVYC